MSTLRWIVIGILGGAIYSWLVTISFARTFAIVWPQWYQPLFKDQLGLGILLWDIAMGLPAILFALLLGLVLTKVVHKAALPASIVGAFVTILYAVSSSAGSGWFHVSTFIVAGLLPLTTFVLEFHYRSFKPDTGGADAA